MTRYLRKISNNKREKPKQKEHRVNRDMQQKKRKKKAVQKRIKTDSVFIKK